MILKIKKKLTKNSKFDNKKKKQQQQHRQQQRQEKIKRQRATL